MEVRNAYVMAGGTYPRIGMAEPCYGTQHVSAALPATQIGKAAAVICFILNRLMDHYSIPYIKYGANGLTVTLRLQAKP